MDTESLEKAKFNCFVYAFGLDADPDFIYFGNTEPKNRFGSDHINHFIKYDVLKKVSSAEKGDYVIYKKDNIFTHAGIVLDKNTIISKFGTEDFAIRRHKIADIFNEYGSDVSYYRRVPAEEIKKQFHQGFNNRL